MDNVIHMQGRTMQRESQPRASGSSAEIIIYPGVRFERLTEEMVEATLPQRSRRLPALHNMATAEELE